MRMYHQNNYSFYNNEKEPLPILSYKGHFLNGYHPSLINAATFTILGVTFSHATQSCSCQFCSPKLTRSSIHVFNSFPLNYWNWSLIPGLA